jgi:LCP family protein required for cell wall assembly
MSGEQSSDKVDEEGVERLLLLGFDGEDGGIGRTDAIMIVVLNRASGEVGVISIPRDLWVDIPGMEPGRINTVVRAGERSQGPGQGLPLLRRVLVEQLGLPVDGAIAVSFQGFTEIIDGLGGIDVEVRCPIEDNFISSEAEGGYESLSLEAGQQHVDGRTALLYSRSRHGRSDTDRSYRQQSVLVGVKKRVLRVGALPRLPALWRTLSQNAKTDLDLSRALSLAGATASADLHSIHGLVIAPPIVTESRSPDGKWILDLDRAKLDEAVSHLFEAPMPGSRGHSPCPPADVALHWKPASQDP